MLHGGSDNVLTQTTWKCAPSDSNDVELDASTDGKTHYAD
jgi:hypothetical protein